MESTTNGRISQTDFASKPEPKSKPKRKPAKRKPRKPNKARKAALVQMKAWSERFVVPAIILSAALNGWASVLNCESENQITQSAAGLVGALIPGFVWVAFKGSGWAFKAEYWKCGLATGLAGVALLLLSLWHCAESIAYLTGSGWWMGLLMAVGIDYGLVSSEVAAIVAHVDEE